MPRKVVIRRKDVSGSSSAIFQLEQMVKADFKNIWNTHLEDLANMAAEIEADAKELAPVYQYTKVYKKGEVIQYVNKKVIPGMLKDSISVKVSRSNRYPGIVAKATAHNIGSHFDYALVQEENTYFNHIVGQAHYLSEPFYSHLDYYMYKLGSKLEMTDEIENYIDSMEK